MSRSNDPGRDLVKDSEAFLRGRLAERYQKCALPVPAWAWTHLLAHGSHSDLVRARAGGSSPRRDRYSGWRAARALLAAEVLDLVPSTCQLDDLQRKVLVPMELCLAHIEVEAPLDAREWVTLVDETLAACRRSARRSEHDAQFRNGSRQGRK